MEKNRPSSNIPYLEKDSPQENKAFSIWRDSFERLLKNKLAVVSLFIIILLFLIAIFGQYLTPYDYRDRDPKTTYAPSSTAHWLGTDSLGRDVFSRVIYGTRTAMLVSILVVGFSSLIGIVVGSLAGYTGGWVDTLLMWLTDQVMAFPFLILGVVMTVSLRPPLSKWMEDTFMATQNPIFRQTYLLDLFIVVVVITFTSWPLYARLLRSQVMAIRNNNYVLAARALGVPTFTIIIKYIIPNAIGPVIVAMSSGLGSAMLTESAYSYLGIGIQPPIPTWGGMINEGMQIWIQSPLLLATPAAVLALATVSFSFLGDGLNDALNPRQWKGKR